MDDNAYIQKLLAEIIELRKEIIRLKQYILELDREAQTGESKHVDISS